MTIEEIGKRIETHALKIDIVVHRPEKETQFSKALLDSAALLHAAGGGGVTMSEGSGEGVPEPPAVAFKRPRSGRIIYMAVPSGRELAPFEEMLLWSPESDPEQTADFGDTLDVLDRPVSILVFIAASCPHCPNAVRAANRVALHNSHVTSTIIDAEQYPALAGRFNVRTVPMTVIDDHLLFNAVVTPAELASAIASRDSEGYLEVVLQSHVTTGNIDLAARLLLDDPRAADAFLSIWKRSTLSERMGLMLLAAQALDEKPDVFDTAVPGLIGLLGAADDALRGDSVDLLGQIGHPDARLPLESLLRDRNPDIVEIAEDALENLTEREE